MINELKFAMNAYSQAPVLRDFIVESFNIKGVQFYIFKNPKKIVISFRGTSEWKDWLFNGNFCKRTVPYDTEGKIKVHSGFYNAYMLVREIIHKRITKTDNILIVGHSLGGAIATLCAVDIQFNFPEKRIECYTFASPKVGNWAFKQSYDKRVIMHFRVQQSFDIVPRLPFFFMGFFHVGVKLSLFKVGHSYQSYYKNLWKKRLSFN
jgi:triacylglycerol lipase